MGGLVSSLAQPRLRDCCVTQHRNCLVYSRLAVLHALCCERTCRHISAVSSGNSLSLARPLGSPLHSESAPAFPSCLWWAVESSPQNCCAACYGGRRSHCVPPRWRYGSSHRLFFGHSAYSATWQVGDLIYTNTSSPCLLPSMLWTTNVWHFGGKIWKLNCFS